jgi:hypothetical protein
VLLAGAGPLGRRAASAGWNRLPAAGLGGRGESVLSVRVVRAQCVLTSRPVRAWSGGRYCCLVMEWATGPVLG